MEISPKKPATKEEKATPLTNMETSTPSKSIAKRSEAASAMSVPSSRKKAMFDSPKPIPGSSSMSLSSPAGMNLQGMTPLSSLRGTFATPYSAEMFSNFSPEDNMNLNKALFSDEDSGNMGKTPMKQEPAPTPRELKMMIGGSEDAMSSFIANMQYNRVSISPMHTRSTLKRSLNHYDDDITSESKIPEKEKTPPLSANKSIHFADGDDDIVHESPDKLMTALTTAVGDIQTPGPAHVTQDSIDSQDIPGPSPFVASLTPMGPYDGANTPMGHYDQGFWGRQLGFSPQDSALTPFKSPAFVFSAKKGRTPLSVLSVNSVQKRLESDPILMKADPNGDGAGDVANFLLSPSPAKKQKTVKEEGDATLTAQ